VSLITPFVTLTFLDKTFQFLVSYYIHMSELSLTFALERHVKTIASLSHRPIVLTDSIDYRTIGLLHNRPNTNDTIYNRNLFFFFFYIFVWLISVQPSDITRGLYRPMVTSDNKGCCGRSVIIFQLHLSVRIPHNFIDGFEPNFME